MAVNARLQVNANFFEGTISAPLLSSLNCRSVTLSTVQLQAMPAFLTAYLSGEIELFFFAFGEIETISRAFVSSMLCAYKDMVRLKSACPMMACRVFGFIPLSMQIVAKVSRKA